MAKKRAFARNIKKQLELLVKCGWTPTSPELGLIYSSGLGGALLGSIPGMVVGYGAEKPTVGLPLAIGGAVLGGGLAGALAYRSGATIVRQIPEGLIDPPRGNAFDPRYIDEAYQYTPVREPGRLSAGDVLIDTLFGALTGGNIGAATPAQAVGGGTGMLAGAILGSLGGLMARWLTPKLKTHDDIARFVRHHVNLDKRFVLGIFDLYRDKNITDDTRWLYSVVHTAALLEPSYHTMYNVIAKLSTVTKVKGVDPEANELWRSTLSIYAAPLSLLGTHAAALTSGRLTRRDYRNFLADAFAHILVVRPDLAKFNKFIDAVADYATHQADRTVVTQAMRELLSEYHKHPDSELMGQYFPRAVQRVLSLSEGIRRYKPPETFTIQDLRTYYRTVVPAIRSFLADEIASVVKVSQILEQAK